MRGFFISFVPLKRERKERKMFVIFKTVSVSYQQSYFYYILKQFFFYS